MPLVMDVVYIYIYIFVIVMRTLSLSLAICYIFIPLIFISIYLFFFLSSFYIYYVRFRASAFYKEPSHTPANLSLRSDRRTETRSASDR